MCFISVTIISGDIYLLRLNYNKVYLKICKLLCVAWIRTWDA